MFTKTNSGGTDHVWFYDMQADGLSLDDKRQLLVPAEKQGVIPEEALTAEEHEKNNLPDILVRYGMREDSERENPRTAQSFTVTKDEIAKAGYDLSLNRYKEIVYAPAQIIAELREMETEIAQGLSALEEMLK